MRKILFLFLGVFLVGRYASAEEQKLSQAYEYQVLERVKDIFSVKAPQGTSEHPLCGTPIFVELNHNRSRFSAKIAALLEPFISRPGFGGDQEYTYDTRGGNIKLHYAKTGADAVFQANVDVNPLDGVPDYVNLCADIFDLVWAKEVDSMGYNPPPSDYWYQPNGGDGKLDVYLKLIEGNIYGYTEPESSSAAKPSSYTSYIVVQNDYTNKCYHHDDPIDCLRVTAAHEFFHTIQFGYDAAEFEYIEHADTIISKQYWMEMSAVWMEDQVYDGVNDYLNYLPFYFGHPDWSLKTFGRSGDGTLFPYGACVWPIYLSEKFGVGIIKDIWYQCGLVAGPNVISCLNDHDCSGGNSATDIALKARGSTFEDAFREFTVWNYFTGDRARTQIFYSEGDLFPKVRVDSSYDYHTDYPVNSPSGQYHPYGLGSNYIIFKPEEKQGGMSLSFLPSNPNYAFEVSVMGYNKDVNEPVIDTVQINHQTGEVDAAVYNWTSFNEIILIPAATSRNGDSYFTYSYSADYDSSFHGEQPFPQKDWIGQNFPNPFVIKGGADSTFFPFNLSSRSDVEILIFAISGELIWRYKENDKIIGSYTERNKCPAWDGKNENGEYVTSGIYLYQVKTKNSSVIKKIAVVR